MGSRTWDTYDRANPERRLPWRKRYKWPGVFAFGAVILALAAVFLYVRVAHSAPIDAKDIRVIDGDTIRLHQKKPDVRLVGFNSPETRRAQCDAERKLGGAATRRLRELVKGGNLDFEYVACSCPPGTELTRKCNFGRRCGTLKANGRDVGEILIAEKLAVPFQCGATSCPRLPIPWCAFSPLSRRNKLYPILLRTPFPRRSEVTFRDQESTWRPSLLTVRTLACFGKAASEWAINACQSKKSGPDDKLGGTIMKLPRRTFLHLAAGAAALPGMSRIARAQTYPTRPVRIIVTFAAGSANDVNGRVIGQWLSERLRQPFIVEARPGGGGNIGAAEAIRSRPDGYTLFLISISHATNESLYANLPYSIVRDITPVASLFRASYVMVVNPSLPVKTVPEFIAYAKANPGRSTWVRRGSVRSAIWRENSSSR